MTPSKIFALKKEVSNAKYMIQASYVGEGLKGLLKEGGTKRRDTVAQVIEGMG